MSAHGGKKAILAALGANAGIAVAKFAGFLITGSSSMLAESVHSVADTSNQGLLLLGQKKAERDADQLHPFGYGRNRYFYSFVVALVLFTLGSLFAIYEGIHKIQHPEELNSAFVAIAILVIAICLEGYSFRTAAKESRPLKGNASWWNFIRTSRSPELPGCAARGHRRIDRSRPCTRRRRPHDGDRKSGLRRHRNSVHRCPCSASSRSF